MVLVSGVVPLQGLGVPVDVVFWSGLSTEVVGRVESFLCTRLGEIVRVCGHDDMDVWWFGKALMVRVKVEK